LINNFQSCNNLLKMKKMKFFKTIVLFSFLASIISLQSCNSKPSEKTSSAGKTSEMLVVMNDVHWKSEIGESIKSFFRQEMEGLSTDEPCYDVVQMSKNSFNKLFQKHRNIFIVEIDNNKSKPSLEIRKDVWSQPQIVIKLIAPDKESFLLAFDARKDQFLELFDEAERRRIIKAFKQDENFKIRTTLKNSMNLSLVIPNGFYIGKQKDNFIWLRKITRNFNNEIMIYSYPYTDTIAFNPQQIINVRNEITKSNIPGHSDSSYMAVSDIFPSTSKILELNGNYAIETRGLWIVKKDFMGGPFLSYTVLDKKANRVVTVDGSIYYPNNKKRDLMRQLESIFYTLNFPEDTILHK